MSREERLREQIRTLNRIGIALSAERDLDRLLEKIVEEARGFTGADAGTLYLVEGESLKCVVVQNDSLKRWGRLDLPPVPLSPEYVSAYVALTGKVVNIPDVYSSRDFNFEGPRRYDALTGYRTKSMLVVPMRDHRSRTIGVLQLINALSPEGKVVPFGKEYEELVLSLASQAAVAIDNARLISDLERTLESFVEALASTIDARDPYTAGHSYRVMQYTLAMAELDGASPREMKVYEYAALLHDYGKIGVRDAVLLKPGKLDPEEHEEVMKHVVYTQEILSKIYFPEELREVPDIAGSHQEKYDGSGYPRGLKDDEIPRGARIMCVADVFDALTSERPYRPRMPIGQALSVIREGAGSHFDPEVVELFFKLPLSRVLGIMAHGRGEPPVDLGELSDVTLGDFYEALRERSPEEMLGPSGGEV
ncbi:MAG: diguanylate cyclase [Candidatus Latescibacterota bacterium]|nr:MAG: diguanylate cyclase [Candidatus Latescibacterota bacterium]